MATKIAHKEFTSNVNRETSSSEYSLGTHFSTLDLYLMDTNDGTKHFVCEWSIEAIDEFESIGLWVTGDELTDYDGVFSLPVQVIELLESIDIKVSEDFRDE